MNKTSLDDCTACAWHTVAVIPCELGKVYAVFRNEGEAGDGIEPARPVVCWALQRNPKTHEEWVSGMALYEEDCARLIDCHAMIDFVGYYVSDGVSRPTPGQVEKFVADCDAMRT